MNHDTEIHDAETVQITFYCPHALADGNQRIRIRDKTLGFSAI